MTLCRADRVLLSGGAAMLGNFLLLGFTPLAFAVPALFAAVIADGVARPSSSTFYPTTTHGSGRRREVALTFDDGPDPDVTPGVLETLARFDARATFFTIGRNLDAQLDIGRRIAAEGHELGNHSWRHVYWQNFFGRRTHGAEIDRTTALIQRLTNSSVEPLYRPPVGLKSPELAHAAVARQLRIVAWSIHSRDTMLKDPQRIASRVLATIAPGDIVLLHDGHDLPGRHRHAGASALPLILQGLKERQLAAVTVSELIDE